MNDLKQMKCAPCREEVSDLTEDEIVEFLQQVPEWKISEHEGIKQLERIYNFDDFALALAFTNKVAELAEEVDHHPALLTEWGSVKVTWWTHKIEGLHSNDFIMAAKTDQLF